MEAAEPCVPRGNGDLPRDPSGSHFAVQRFFWVGKTRSLPPWPNYPGSLRAVETWGVCGPARQPLGLGQKNKCSGQPGNSDHSANRVPPVGAAVTSKLLDLFSFGCHVPGWIDEMTTDCSIQKACVSPLFRTCASRIRCRIPAITHGNSAPTEIREFGYICTSTLVPKSVTQLRSHCHIHTVCCLSPQG